MKQWEWSLSKIVGSTLKACNALSMKIEHYTCCKAYEEKKKCKLKDVSEDEKIHEEGKSLNK